MTSCTTSRVASDGSLSAPYPLGTEITVDEWSFTLDTVDPDAGDTIDLSRVPLTPAPDGAGYMTLSYTVTNGGDSPDLPPDVPIEPVSDAGDTLARSPVILLEPSSDFGSLAPGGARTFTVVCWLETDSARLIRVTPRPFEDIYYRP